MKKKRLAVLLVTALVSIAGLNGCIKSNTQANNTKSVSKETKADTKDDKSDDNDEEKNVAETTGKRAVSDDDAEIESLIADLDESKNKYLDETYTYTKFQSVLEEAQKSDYKKVVDYAKSLMTLADEINNVRTLWLMAEESFNSEDYVSAIKLYKQIEDCSFSEDIDSKYTYYDQAVERVDSSYEKYREKIDEEILACENSEDYVGAISMINAALDVFPDDKDYTAKLSSLSDKRDTQIKNQAEQYVADKEWDKAFDILYENGFTEEYDNVETQYRSAVLSWAKDRFQNVGYEEAIGVIQNGINELESHGSKTKLSANDELYTAMAEYEEYRPVDLFTMDTYYGSNPDGPYYGEKANTGELFDNVYYFSEWETSRPAYKLDGNYNRLTGTLFLPYDMRNGSVRILVYGDETLLAAYKVSKGEEPVKIDVDISGVKTLMVTSKDDNGSSLYAYCSNFMISK